MKEQQEQEKIYNSKPNVGSRPAKKTTKRAMDEEEEDTLYSFGGKPIKKPKAPPVMPKAVPEDPEKKKLREQKAAEQQALKM